MFQYISVSRSYNFEWPKLCNFISRAALMHKRAYLCHMTFFLISWLVVSKQKFVWSPNQMGQPIFRQYFVAYVAMDAVEAELKDFDIISHANVSDWIAPVVVVRKPNGEKKSKSSSTSRRHLIYLILTLLKYICF